MALTPDQSKLFDDFDRMFMTEGWKTFVQDIKEKQDQLFPQLLNSSTREELFFCKGRNDVYTYILGLQNLMEQARLSMEEPDVETDDV